MKEKLVRDYIPSIIAESGKTCDYRIATMEELEEKLYEKMNEELYEFIENPCIEEAADMYEVLKSICWLHRINIDEVINAARDKAIKRGGFSAGLVLEKVR